MDTILDGSYSFRKTSTRYRLTMEAEHIVVIMFITMTFALISAMVWVLFWDYLTNIL